MKRLSYVLLGSLFIMSLSTSVLAFEGVELGFKGGLLLAKASGEISIDEFGDVEFDSKAGLGLGAYMSINISKYFAIQPEILYMQKGGQHDMSFEIDFGGQLISADVELDANLNYLEIPILAKVKVPTASSITPFFIAGPAVAFNIDAEAEITVTATVDGYTESETGTEDIKDEISDTDVGIIFGGGAEFDLGTVNLFFDVRYNIGLLNVDDIGVNDIKNRAFSFIAGISFPL